METKKWYQFAVVFILLAGFTTVALGAVQSQGELVKAVAAAKNNGNSNNQLLSVSDNIFDSKVLRFLRLEKVCSVTAEQAGILAGEYETESKTFDVDGESVDVMYVNGVPLNKKIVEEKLGEDIDNQCLAVHGYKVLALIVSPMIVS